MCKHSCSPFKYFLVEAPDERVVDEQGEQSTLFLRGDKAHPAYSIYAGLTEKFMLWCFCQGAEDSST